MCKSAPKLEFGNEQGGASILSEESLGTSRRGASTLSEESLGTSRKGASTLSEESLGTSRVQVLCQKRFWERAGCKYFIKREFGKEQGASTLSKEILGTSGNI
jgi:hypothetical protein